MTGPPPFDPALRDLIARWLAALIGRLAVHYPGDAQAIADAVTIAGRVA